MINEAEMIDKADTVTLDACMKPASPYCFLNQPKEPYLFDDNNSGSFSGAFAKSPGTTTRLFEVC